MRDDGEAEAGSFLMRGEIRFENFLTVFGRNAMAVIAHFQNRFGGSRAAHFDFDLSTFADGLRSVDK